MQYFVIVGTIDEYKLLEDMNKATINKYAEMKDISTNINIAMKNLDDKCMLSYLIRNLLN